MTAVEMPGRVRVLLAKATKDGALPEAITTSSSPREIWAHARRGEWTSAESHSRIRLLATGYAAGAIAVAAVCDSAKWIVQPVGSPIEAITSPRTPMQVMAHARTGAWCASENAAKRWVGHGRAIAVTAVAVACDGVKWAVQRPARLAAVFVFASLIGTGLAQLPVLGALVPDLFNLTAW